MCQSIWSRCLQPAVDGVRDVFGLKIPAFNWCWQRRAEQRGWLLLWPSCWLSDRVSFVLGRQPSITHTQTCHSTWMSVLVKEKEDSPQTNSRKRDAAASGWLATFYLLFAIPEWTELGQCVFKVGHCSGYTRMKYFLLAVRSGWCIHGFDAFKVNPVCLCRGPSGFVKGSFSWVCIGNLV